MRELRRVALAVLVVGLSLLGYTWLHLELMGSGYRVQALEQRLHELERTQRHLQLEEAYLSSPQRVETRALQQLGMQPPALGQLLFAPAPGSVPPPAPAPPAPRAPAAAPVLPLGGPTT